MCQNELQCIQLAFNAIPTLNQDYILCILKNKAIRFSFCLDSFFAKKKEKTSISIFFNEAGFLGYIFMNTNEASII